jgi:hypothetical protein
MSMAEQPGTVVEWSGYMAAIDAAGQRVIARLPRDATDDDRHQAYLTMFGALTSVYFTIVHSDPDHPLLVPWLGFHQNILAPCADTVYLNTAINGEGVYRFTAEIGDLPIAILQTQGSSQMVTGTKVRALCDIDLTKLQRDGNGRIELLLSQERPAGYRGEWVSLHPTARLAMLRLVSDDWGRQTDPRLTIERLDVPSRAVRRTAAELDNRMRMIAPYLENTATRWVDHVAELELDGVVNALKMNDYGFVGGIPTQSYFEGIFDIRDDEALIIEAPMPTVCGYWSICLADRLYSTIDWINNQASLNRSQARSDGDGRLRVVVANVDPGVPNWVDTVGRRRCVMQWRWANCSSHPHPSVRKVALGELRNYLPEDTPSISIAERDASLRRRREAAQLRRLW